jgi:hypothetical protein
MQQGVSTFPPEPVWLHPNVFTMQQGVSTFQIFGLRCRPASFGGSEQVLEKLRKIGVPADRDRPDQKKPIHPVRIGVGVERRQPGSPGVPDYGHAA